MKAQFLDRSQKYLNFLGIKNRNSLYVRGSDFSDTENDPRAAIRVIEFLLANAQSEEFRAV